MKKILIIDSDVDFLNMMKGELEAAGYEVVVAQDRGRFAHHTRRGASRPKWFRRLFAFEARCHDSRHARIYYE